MKIHNYPTPAETSQAAADFIFSNLRKSLSEGETLLLVSGGSVSRDIVPLITKKIMDLDHGLVGNLHIALVDERFGEPWHKDSNMKLLSDAGLVDITNRLGVDLALPLVKKGATKLQVLGDYTQKISTLFKLSQGRIIAVLGLGEDGHTAGIKPTVAREEFSDIYSHKLVAAYTAHDFTRITLTPQALHEVNLAIIYACGDAKHAAIRILLTQKKLPPHKFPAVVVNNSVSAHIFTDFVLTHFSFMPG